MKHRLGLFVAAAAVILLARELGTTALLPPPVAGSVEVHAVLPSADSAKTVLNSTHRHRQWVNVPAGFAEIRAFVVYPDRSNNAPAVVVSAARQGASDWIRAVADRVAADGFIAIVPDVLSGLGPNGGDADAFPDAGAVAEALQRLGPAEIARRTSAVREYAMALPSATGRGASLNFDWPTDRPADRTSQSGHAARIDVAVEAPVAGQRAASFSGSSEAYVQALAFLRKQTGDRPVAGANPDVPEDHSAHFGMMMAGMAMPQTVPGSPPEGGRAYSKDPKLPASGRNAGGTLQRSKLRREFVDIPVGSVKLHTWVEYPDGDGKAPIVILMEHSPGLDDSQRAVADQLAQEGFIAIFPDLASGLGPNGGNFDSFVDSDSVSRAVARLTEKDRLDRYIAARNWGMNLPRANGKSASMGFCAGGGYSFRFAAGIPGLNAAVSYYGSPPMNFDYSKVKAPILAFYGEEDPRVTATLAPTQAAMKEHGKSFEAHVYPHATHGFLEFQVDENPAAVKDAWPRTIAFLKTHTM